MAVRVAHFVPSLANSLLSLSVFFVTAAFFGVLQLVNGNWNDWMQATCFNDDGITGCFCEYPREGLIRQPANTWSNLAYTICGALVLCESIEQHLNSGRIRLTPQEQIGSTFAALFGLGNVILGFGSGWFHASLTLHGQWIDNCGMYYVVSAPALFALSQARIAGLENPNDAHAVQQINKGFMIIYFFLNAFLTWLVLAVPESRRFLFGVLVVFAIVCEGFASSKCGEARNKMLDTKWFFRALGTFVVALIIWILDNTGTLCEPHSLIQGHAAWHLLCGAAAWLWFIFYHPIAFPNQKGISKVDLEESSCSVV